MTTPTDAGGVDTADVAQVAEEASEHTLDTQYSNAADWVHRWLLTHYRRPNVGIRWCQYWFEHAEAASRLEALWQAWEAARANEEDVAAVSDWWLNHCDRHMAVLLSEQGPFQHCNYRTGEHMLQEPLLVAEPGAGMYRGWDHPEERAAYDHTDGVGDLSSAGPEDDNE